MGIVFEAEQVSLRRRVALKVLPFAAAFDPQQLRRFQIEAQAAAQLHHTNIVPIFSVGCERGVHYYAMQYIEGQTLAALIRDLRRLAGLQATSGEATVAGASLAEEVASGRLAPAPAARRRSKPSPSPPWGEGGRRPDEGASDPPAERMVEGPIREPRARGRGRSPEPTRTPAYFRTVAHLGLQAAEALDYAHVWGSSTATSSRRNLLVDAHGNLWVADFGLARMQADSGLTMTGDVIGTLRYMSPEQASARARDRRPSHRRLFAGRDALRAADPATGLSTGATAPSCSTRSPLDEPKRPRFWNPAIPRDLETIVLKALAREPRRVTRPP